jgi:heme/copper-type cytochrome/quinol oxidase subunit 2
MVNWLTVADSGKQAPKQLSKLQTVAIIIIAFVVVFASFYYLGFFDEFQPSTNTDTQGATSLTPARELEGTWKTAFPVTFYIRTDFETFGVLQEVGSENRSMIWTITATSDENVVDVEVQFTVSNRQLIADSGYTPDVSPMFLKGIISGTRLTLKTGDRTVAECNFTTDIITATWSDHWSMAYEQEVYTATNSLILTRQ